MRYLAISALLGGTALGALSVDVHDASSIKDAAKLVAGNLMAYYSGNEPGKTPGLLPDPYYWWEAGAMWDTLINYWHHTGDDQYNDLVTQALLWQTGPGNAYMPANQTASMGNDDQGFWAMAALTAAEDGLPNDDAKDGQDWLDLAENVFVSQVARWNESTCGGGLRWQIFPINNGYNYKNSASNAGLFNIASRLAKYTGNDTYADWAGKTWDWMQAVGFMDEEYNVFDGGHVEMNCSDTNKGQYSYIAGNFLQGAAFMYNQTNGADIWKTRVTGLLNRTLEVFIDKSGAPTEISCEQIGSCTTDMHAFKGILVRGLASAAALAPFTDATITPVLEKTAAAAGQVCDGKTGACGFLWTQGKDDGSRGVGEQLNALSALSAILASEPGATSSSNGTGTTTGTTTGTGTPASTSSVTQPTGGATVNGRSVLALFGGLLSVAVFIL